MIRFKNPILTYLLGENLFVQELNQTTSRPSTTCLSANLKLRMVSYLSLLLLLSLGTACTPEASPVYTIIQGKLPATTEEASISHSNKWEELSFAEDGTFTDTLTITAPQYVHLSLGDDLSTRVYLAPGDEVTIFADSMFSFSGSNTEINEYLYQNDQALDAFQYENHQSIFTKKETEYLKFRDSLKFSRLNHLAQLPIGTEVFQGFHQKDIEYDYQYDMARYPNYHSYYFNDYEPTALITDFYEGVPLDNEAHAQHYRSYRSLVDLILDKHIENIGDTSLSPLEANLAVLKDIQSPTILHNRLTKALYYFTVNEADMEGMRNNILDMAKLDRTKKAITEHYDAISQLQPGNPAPSFDLKNYAGGKTKLADLEGKYVYIDVWATWCNPCIREIPHLKKIEKEFHDANIEFVSISIDDEWAHGTWRNMIEEQDLVGTQLLADNGWNSTFVKDYSLQGLPHFILLDDQGNIISANVERPSDPQLKERLEALGL